MSEDNNGFTVPKEFEKALMETDVIIGTIEISKNGAIEALGMIANLEAGLQHIEANLDNFAAHEKAAVQKWLLDVKNRVRSLLSRIV